MYDALGLPVRNDLVSDEALIALYQEEQTAQGEAMFTWIRSRMPIIVSIDRGGDHSVRGLIRGEQTMPLTADVIRVVVQGTEEADRVTRAWGALRYARQEPMGGAAHMRIRYVPPRPKK